MKGFLLAIVGDFLAVNALVSVIIPNVVQKYSSSMPIMSFLLLTGVELSLAGMVLCIVGLAKKKGCKLFNVLGIVLAIIPALAVSSFVA